MKTKETLALEKLLFNTHGRSMWTNVKYLDTK